MFSVNRDTWAIRRFCLFGNAYRKSGFLTWDRAHYLACVRRHCHQKSHLGRCRHGFGVSCLLQIQVRKSRCSSCSQMHIVDVFRNQLFRQIIRFFLRRGFCSFSGCCVTHIYFRKRDTSQDNVTLVGENQLYLVQRKLLTAMDLKNGTIKNCQACHVYVFLLMMLYQIDKSVNKVKRRRGSWKQSPYKLYNTIVAHLSWIPPALCASSTSPIMLKLSDKSILSRSQWDCLTF